MPETSRSAAAPAPRALRTLPRTRLGWWGLGLLGGGAGLRPWRDARAS